MKTMSVMLATLGIGLVFGGCNRTTISPNWGTAYQDMRAKQALNPAAGEQLDPVEGQDGRINATAMEAYQKSFERPDAEFSKSLVSSGVKTN